MSFVFQSRFDKLLERASTVMIQYGARREFWDFYQAIALALAVLLLTETTQWTPVPSFGFVSFEGNALRSRRREREGGEGGLTIYDYVNETLIRQRECSSGEEIRSRLDVCNEAKDRKKERHKYMKDAIGRPNRFFMYAVTPHHMWMMFFF